MKMKTLIHTLIFSHLRRIVRALSKVKSILTEIIRENQSIHILHSHNSNPRNFKFEKIFLGSFRLHYNWASASSHVLPPPTPVGDDQSAWSSTDFSTGVHHQHGAGSKGSRSWRFPWSQRTLSGYLQWLEETSDDDEDHCDGNAIDKLADLFIAKCHEKFILEKQESDRRFQEMLARGL